ncbi:hypothetical protein Tco_0854832 [Tanacetum coccineum]
MQPPRNLNEEGEGIGNLQLPDGEVLMKLMYDSPQPHYWMFRNFAHVDETPPFKDLEVIGHLRDCLNGEFVRVGLRYDADGLRFDADGPMSSKASKALRVVYRGTCTYDLSRPGGIFLGTMPDADVIVKRLSTGLLTPLLYCFSCLEMRNNRLTRSLSSMSDTKKDIIYVTPDLKVSSITHIRRLSEPKKITSLKIRSAEPVSKPKLSSGGPEIKKKYAIMSVDQSKAASLPELKIKTSSNLSQKLSYAKVKGQAYC